MNFFPIFRKNSFSVIIRGQRNDIKVKYTYVNHRVLLHSFLASNTVKIVMCKDTNRQYRPLV